MRDRQTDFVSGYSPNQPPLLMQQRAGAALLFAIETAMRAGEIAGLKWEHIKPAGTHRIFATNQKRLFTHRATLNQSNSTLNQLAQLEPNKQNSVFQLTSRSLDSNFAS